MNEYTIYFLLILSSIIFQTFWSWCTNEPKKTEIEQKKDNSQLVDRYTKEAVKELQQQHEEEIKKIKINHKKTLRKKRTQLHKSCQRRNETIKALRERNYALQEKLKKDKETKNLVVLKVLEALKPLDG